MPTLHWIGKDKVINHHLDVPFRLLAHQYGVLADGTQTAMPAGGGNQLVHGDNLEALKALLPQYEGRVKCIYIDPPYNTGNERWVYNDNVSDPKLRKWLGQVVGKESEDLSRHDKWLCMMYPRLKLLHKLLAEDGAIFISIDDTELYNLKNICDEIWGGGGGNYICTLTWQKKYGPANDAKYVSETHEYILCYAKNKSLWRPNLLPRAEEQLKAFKNPDADPRGIWRASDLSAKTYSATTDYPITGPHGDTFHPPKSRSWIVTQARFADLLADNRITFGANGKGRPMQKKFLSDVRDGITAQTWWSRDFAGDNKTARYELKDIFPDNPFDTPKPTSLVERILQLATDRDSIVLDSFAGSGTTAHAVLKLNQQDGGNRRFILVEMEDYAEHITAERVRRVLQGYAGQPGLDGSFDYLTLGEPVFTEGGGLNEQAGLPGLRQYLYYAETRQPLPATPDALDNAAFLGLHNNTAYYFHYEPDTVTTLGHEFLSTMRTRAGQYVIYADNCLLPGDFLTRHSIIFKKIPRDVSRF